MPRNKKGKTDLNIMNERVAREEAHVSLLSPEPRSPISTAQAKERITDHQDQEKRIWVEAGLTPLPPDEVEDFPFGKPDMVRNGQRYHGDHGKDEMIAEYDVYINKPTKKIMILQYPNRGPGQPYCERTGQKPLELRIKPKCGLIEVDIPMDVHTNFDKEKGIIYGEAMRKSRVLQDGGSYGMAGGFGIGSKPRATASGRQPSAAEEPTHESLLTNFDDANNKGHVMNKVTLGGQIVPFKPGNDPNYYIGVFKGHDLYLNKVDAIVQLRPQFAHLDALLDLEKPARAQRATENGEEESEAKAVNMSVKSTEAEETDMYGGVRETLKLLKAMREEPWLRMTWIDQDSQEAYDTYDEQLTIAPGKHTPDLISSMTNEQWLDAMSAPRIDPTNPGRRHMSMPGRDSDPSDSEDSEETDEEDGSECQRDWETDDGEREEDDGEGEEGNDEDGGNSGDEGAEEKEL